MSDFLQLEHLRTTSVVHTGTAYIVEAESINYPVSCPRCNSDLHKHGSELQAFNDTPSHGLPVRIDIDRLRFRCPSCRKTYYQYLEDMHQQRRATKRFVDWVAERSLIQTFTSVAVESGIAEKTVREIFSSHISALDQQNHFPTPEILGIDDTKSAGAFRCILTDIKGQSVFEILDSCSEVALNKYFKSLPDSENVRVVVMDQSPIFRKVIQTHLPGRPIVMDHFHATKTANDAFERVRRRIWRSMDKTIKSQIGHDRHKLKQRWHKLDSADQKMLSDLFSLYPEIKVAHQAKEYFCRLYEYTSREEAENAGFNWQQKLPQSIEKDFRQCSTLLTEWFEEIFNYYDYEVTNAYTESMNKCLKNFDRAGNGYGFETIRGKILYNKLARKPAYSIRKAVRQTEKPNYEDSHDSTNPYALFITCETIQLGPHIPTLEKMIASKEIT